MIDPWYLGSVLRTSNPENIVINIPDAAHHLDLRAAHPNDPESVVEAREIEKAAIRKWIEQKKSRSATSNSMIHHIARHALIINLALVLIFASF